MAGLLRGGFATGLLVLTLTESAHGFGFGWRRAYTTSYYGSAYYTPSYLISYYAPTYYAPQPAYLYSYPYQCPPMMPAVAYPYPGHVPYAQPRPAPPSGTPEPPLDRPGRSPKITESRYVGGDTGKVDKPPAPGESCRVGFWNLTGRDVTLVVDGKTHFLRKDHALTLDLGRQFTWKRDQGEARNERVPADQNTHEIVLRPKAGR